MKSKDIREMTDPELVLKTEECKRERLNLKVQGRTGELKATAKIGQLRKDIAKIKTEQTARAKKATSGTEVA